MAGYWVAYCLNSGCKVIAYQWTANRWAGACPGCGWVGRASREYHDGDNKTKG